MVRPSRACLRARFVGRRENSVPNTLLAAPSRSVVGWEPEKPRQDWPGGEREPVVFETW